MSDFPEDYPPFTPEYHDTQPDGTPWTPEAIVNHGGSCIVGPLGTFLADPVWDKEDIIFAELSIDELLGARVCLSNCIIISWFANFPAEDGLRRCG